MLMMKFMTKEVFIAAIFGVVLGFAFRHGGGISGGGDGSSSATSNGGWASSDAMNELGVQFVSEYDLIPTNSTLPRTYDYNHNTPMDFENAMRATGITDEEYAACNSSIYQDPNRKICIKLGPPVCYKKKLKYIKDESGDMVPYYVKDGATEVTCPYPYRSAVYVGQRLPNPQHWSWQADCYVTSGGVDRQAICYAKLPCKEEKPQWTARLDINNHAGNYYMGWTGGFDPAKSPWEDARNVMTEPYEGKFCLQKAALKALSRQGWELIEPWDAFTAETWKVIKRTPLL